MPNASKVFATEFAQSSPRRILMVAARYFPLTGGIETHVYETARRLADMGHSVEILTTDLTGTLPSDEFASGIHVRRVAAWPRRSDVRIAPAIYRDVMRGGWDIIHIQGYHTLVAPLAILAAIRRSVPFVVTFHSGGHSSRFRNALRSIQRSVLSPLMARADQLIGVSQFEADFFSRTLGIPREKFVVVPNGAGLPSRHASRAEQSTDRPLILSVGRLERYKGHQRAIRAMPFVLARKPSARLRIVGQGPYERELQELVEESGLKQAVTISSVPPSDRGAMARLMTQADLMVLLSDYEAHPVSILEALSVAKPVLATKSSGHLEMIENGLVGGIDLDASAQKTAEAILSAIDTPYRPAKVALPSWDDCANRLAEIYDRVLSSKVGADTRALAGTYR